MDTLIVQHVTCMAGAFSATLTVSKVTTGFNSVDILRHRKTATAHVTLASPLNTKDRLLTSHSVKCRVEKCPINGQFQFSGWGESISI
jgi:hypothetical protein